MSTVAVPGVRRVEHVMGMPIIVDVREDDVRECDLDAVFAWFRRVDATFSTFKLDSEISRLNRNELELDEADPEVRWVLGRCEELRVETSGYFDSRAASSDIVDPSGLVKGWSVDRAASILARAGCRNYAVNAGGDVRVSGRATPGFEWLIGIQHPLQNDRLAAVVSLTDGAVATSGAYERGQHVLDPHTHAPPTGVLSVTITGPDLATADAYATAAYAMGTAGPAWTASRRGYEGLTILADGRVLSTLGFPRSAEAAPSPPRKSTGPPKGSRAAYAYDRQGNIGEEKLDD